MLNVFLLLLILTFSARGAEAQATMSAAPPQLETILAKMKAYEDWQRRHLTGYEVHRTFHAVNERFKLESTMTVKTIYRSPDQFENEVLEFRGSTLIRSKVFDKILDAEKDARTTEAKQTVINAENYKFQVIALESCGGRTCYRLKIAPKRKDRFSVEGQIWVDEEQGAIVRIQGSPAKKPSFWTLHTDIERRYQQIDSIWFCQSIISTSDIFVGGHSSLNVENDYVSVQTRDLAQP